MGNGFSVAGPAGGPSYPREYIVGFRSTDLPHRLKARVAVNPTFRAKVHRKPQIEPRMLVARRLAEFGFKRYVPWSPDRGYAPDILLGASQRYGRIVPQPTPEGLAVFRELGASLAVVFPVLDNLYLPDDFLRDAHRPVAWKNALRQALDNELDYNPEVNGYHKSFVKREFYDDYKYLRLIQGPPESLRLLFGSMIHPLEHVIFSQMTWDWGECQIFFPKYLPTCQRPKAIDEFLIPGLAVVDTDHTAFEAHMTADILRAGECQVFRHMLAQSHPAILARWEDYVLSEQILRMKDMTIRQGPFRESGNSETSIGNGIENLLFFAAVCRLLGIRLLRAVVEGDDGLFQVDHPELLTVEAFLRVGAEIKLKLNARAGDAGFCQLYWDEEHNLVPNVLRKLVRLPWTQAPEMHAGPNVLKGLWKAKVLSLQAEASHCPVLWAVAKRLLSDLAGVRERHDTTDWYHLTQLDFSQVAGPPTEHARVMVEQRDGIPRSVQLELEQQFLDGKFIIDHPFMLNLMEQSTWRESETMIVSFAPGQRTDADWWQGPVPTALQSPGRP